MFSRIADIRSSKIELAPVHSLLNKFDIFGLIETHCETTDVLHLKDYHIFQNHRPRSVNAPHAFVGLAVGVRLELLKGVKFLKPTHSEFMWLKLNKHFFGLQNDIYICIIYVSPSTSSYSSRRDDIFTLVEKDIAQFS